LQKRLGDEIIDFKPYGGYELFLTEDESCYDECVKKLPIINEILKPLLKQTYLQKEIDRFGFNGIRTLNF
jgi:hypothetical protein